MLSGKRVSDLNMQKKDVSEDWINEDRRIKTHDAAGFAGMRYAELLGQILGAAVERLNIVGKSAAPQVEAAQ